VDLWDVWLVVAAGVHLGFQATVTFLVYPALVARGRRGDVSWVEVHGEHSTRITPVVVVVYGGLLVPVLVTAWRLVVDGPQWGAVLAVVGAGLAYGATALVAAPAHGRLGRGWSEAAARRLLRADVVRLLGAVLCLAGAITVVT
jgi:hypothetical protein